MTALHDRPAAPGLGRLAAVAVGALAGPRRLAGRPAGPPRLGHHLEGPHRPRRARGGARRRRARAGDRVAPLLAGRRHDRRRRPRRGGRAVPLGHEQRVDPGDDADRARVPAAARPSSTASGCCPACSPPLVVRRPGAALFAETVAAVIEALTGGNWGFASVYYGVVEGLGVEIVLALMLYRRWGLGAAMAAGAGGGLATTALDLTFYLPDAPADQKLAYLVLTVISAAVIAGAGSWALARALAAHRGARAAGRGADGRAGVTTGPVAVAGPGVGLALRHPPGLGRARPRPRRRAGRDGAPARARAGRASPPCSPVSPACSTPATTAPARRRARSCSTACPPGAPGAPPWWRGRPGPACSCRTRSARPCSRAAATTSRSGSRTTPSRGPRSGPGSRPRCAAWPSPTAPRTRPAACPAASGSGSRSPASSRCGPGLLLLDEPSAMLDEPGARMLREQVGAVLAATGATCVLVEHRLGRLGSTLADRVVVLEPGGGAARPGGAGPGLRRPRRRPRRPRRVGPGPHAAAGPGPDAAGAGAARAGEVLLEARAVAANRRSRARAGLPPVVADVDLAVAAGEVTCVLGDNGTGKSTLALTLAGLEPPAAGQVVAAPALAARCPLAAPAPLASARARDPDRHRLPGARAPVRRGDGRRRARRRAAPGRPPRADGRRPHAGAARAPRPDAARAGQPVHAVRRRAAAARRSPPCWPPAPGCSCSTSPPSVRTPRTWAELVDPARRARRGGRRGGHRHARRRPGAGARRTRVPAARARRPCGSRHEPRALGRRRVARAGQPGREARRRARRGRRDGRSASTSSPRARPSRSSWLALPWCGLRAAARCGAGAACSCSRPRRPALGTALFGATGGPVAGAAVGAADPRGGAARRRPAGTTDPTDLADALAQVAAAAAPLRARRARRDPAARRAGRRVGRARARPPGAGPRWTTARWGGCATTLGRVFALLVLAVRRATVARDRDGGPRVRRLAAAHLGAPEPAARP